MFCCWTVVPLHLLQTPNSYEPGSVLGRSRNTEGYGEVDGVQCMVRRTFQLYSKNMGSAHPCCGTLMLPAIEPNWQIGFLVKFMEEFELG